MFKTLFFLLLTFGFYNAFGAVSVKWMTVASVVIDDGKNRILFDPAWTRPGMRHLLNLEKLKSDENLVKTVLEKNDLKKIDAVFASHSHFDHVLDAPMVAKLTGAIFYTDESSERIARAYKDERIKTSALKAYEKIKIGDFIITPLERKHAQILHLFDFLPGPVPENTDLSFWDYHTGDTWFFLIEHPEGVILLDQGSNPSVDNLKKYTQKVDVLLQGIANRKDDEAILEGYVKAYQPKFFIPLHFDNFFLDFNDGAASDMPGIKITEFLGKMKKAYPSVKTERPQYGKEVRVLEIER